MSSSSSSSFVADHFPSNHAALSKIFSGIGVFVLTMTVGVFFLRDFLEKTERRRMLYLQRPPGVPTQPYAPIDDSTCYWLKRIMRRREGRNLFAQAPTVKLTRPQSTPAAFATAEKKGGQEQRFYRIIALDGGGVRGIITAVILQRLVQVFPGLIDNCDLLAGTSTGGLIACLLGSGYSPR